MKSNPIMANPRPIIEIELSKNDNALAVFMHTTLRPILKQKHDSLCSVIRNNNHLKTDNISGKKETENMLFLKQFFKKNAALRNVLIGIIIGGFTAEELEFYLDNQKEVNRRIIEMVITRFLSEYQ